MKIFLQICAILVIVATICICAIKPEMHKTVFVYNSDYKIVTDEDVDVKTTEIPVMEIQVKPQEQTVKKTIETVSVPKTQTTVSKPIQTIKKQVPQQVKTENKTVAKPVRTTVKTEKKQEQQVQTVVKQETSTKPQTVKVVQTKSVPKVLTQKEEEIAWNVWRSNLQNQIMQDVKLPALPNGIVFRFSFNVDKYGKITNIYTSCDNPAFTPYAIQYIAPVIRSYQGKSILNFPEGSSRTATEFKGGWKISATERLSTPQDYNDYEKVVR